MSNPIDQYIEEHLNDIFHMRWMVSPFFSRRQEMHNAPRGSLRRRRCAKSLVLRSRPLIVQSTNHTLLPLARNWMKPRSTPRGQKDAR